MNENKLLIWYKQIIHEQNRKNGFPLSITDIAELLGDISKSYIRLIVMNLFLAGLCEIKLKRNSDKKTHLVSARMIPATDAALREAIREVAKTKKTLAIQYTEFGVFYGTFFDENNENTIVVKWADLKERITEKWLFMKKAQKDSQKKML